MLQLLLELYRFARNFFIFFISLEKCDIFITFLLTAENYVI